MKTDILSPGIILVFALLISGQADQPMFKPDNCEQWIKLFVPDKIDTSSITMRAVAEITIQEYIPTRELRIQQLTEEYWESQEHQRTFPTVEAFVETLLRLIEEKEEYKQTDPIQHSRVQLLISASNAYARYYGAYDLHSPTQEVVQLSIPGKGWRYIYIDHNQKKINEKIEKHRNEYSSYFMALTPQEAHRSTWEMFPLLLRMENQNDNVAQMLCDNGQVQLSNMLIKARFIDESNIVFITQTKVPKGLLETEYQLVRGKHIRLLRYILRGPELSTQVTYDYSNPDLPWPTRQHLVDRNILSQQTLQERTMNILEVAPNSKWNYGQIYDALMKRHVDYTYEVTE